MTEDLQHRDTGDETSAISKAVLRIPAPKTIWQRVKELRGAPEHWYEVHCANGLCAIRRQVRATQQPLVCTTCGCAVVAGDQGPVR